MTVSYQRSGADNDPLNLWAFSDAHVGSDLRHGRESLADALRQSESTVGFDWSAAVNLGDHSGTQEAPDDAEGREVVRQYSVLRLHRREQVYDIGGNHDRSDVGQPEGRWFDRWLDPTGTHPRVSGVHSNRRPFTVDGSWERYAFRAGNIVFLMMSDRNDPVHRIARSEGGGNPGGVVSGETFDWWRDQVERHGDSIVVSAHHYVLKDTTVASGEWEGCWQDASGEIHQPYHGYKVGGSPRGASHLYFVDGVPGAARFERYLASHPAATAVWLGGHTHTHPDDSAGGKTHIETRWGTHFINVSALTRYHAGATPMSRLLTFTPGSSQLRVRCYLHTDDHAAQGFYPTAEAVLPLPRPFSWQNHLPAADPGEAPAGAPQA